ncbi:MAG: hypothetical protein ABIN96_10915 [Rubrivivax sp.]
MTNQPPSSTPSPAPSIDSRAEFIAALRWGFDAACSAAGRRIVCCSADFADWPLDEPALLAQLTAWLRLPQRRLVLLSADFDPVPRLHPRFADWRRDWVHAVEAWQPVPEQGLRLSCLLCSDGEISVERLDEAQGRGRAAVNARSAHQHMRRLDALLQHCSPAWAGRQLGL